MALAQVAEECRRRYGIEADLIAADLSRPESLDDVIAAMNSKPRVYEVLVNNAGFGVQGAFASTDAEREVQLVNVQLAAAMKLSKTVIPSMISRRSGRILNVASVYSFAPVPFQAVYGACKAFLLSFSSALNSELKGTGVTVTVFCPGITQTEFRKRAGIAEKRKHSGMTAEAAARIAYTETMRGKHIVVPGFFNRLFVLGAELLPTKSVASIVRFINRQRGHIHS